MLINALLNFFNEKRINNNLKKQIDSIIKKHAENRDTKTRNIAREIELINLLIEELPINPNDFYQSIITTIKAYLDPIILEINNSQEIGQIIHNNNVKNILVEYKNALEHPEIEWIVVHSSNQAWKKIGLPDAEQKIQATQKSARDIAFYRDEKFEIDAQRSIRVKIADEENARKIINPREKGICVVLDEACDLCEKNEDCDKKINGTHKTIQVKLDLELEKIITQCTCQRDNETEENSNEYPYDFLGPSREFFLKTLNSEYKISQKKAGFVIEIISERKVNVIQNLKIASARRDITPCFACGPAPLLEFQSTITLVLDEQGEIKASSLFKIKDNTKEKIFEPLFIENRLSTTEAGLFTRADTTSNPEPNETEHTQRP